MPALLGTYSNGQPPGSLFYFLAPIQSRGDWIWRLEGTAQPVWQILARVGIDLFIMLVDGAISVVFRVETTDMGPEATAMDAYEELPEAPDPPADAESTAESLDLRLKNMKEQLLSATEVAEKSNIDGSAHKAADVLSEPDRLVREALIYLERRSILSVESVAVDGTRHWITV